MEIYTCKEMKKPNLLQRLRKKEPPMNGYIAINNLFAQYQSSITEISAEAVEAIAQEYNFSLAKRFEDERLDLFTRYLEFTLERGAISNKRLKELHHIRDILKLDFSKTDSIQEEKARALFEKRASKILAPFIWDHKVSNKLETLAEDLRLSDQSVKGALSEVVIPLLQNYLEPIFKEERFSREEREKLENFLRGGGAKIPKDQEEQLQLFTQYWEIEQGVLPVIEPDINLQKSETLHYTTTIEWMEYRKVTKRINYGGPTVRIKLAKGFYYRAGSLQAQSVSEDVLKVIDSGQIYLTNKRLIFVGARGNKNIRLDKILTINPYTNGVAIQKDSGKSPFFAFEDGVYKFSLILVKLLQS